MSDDMVSRLLALGGRVSSNVEDVTAYPPKVSPRGTTGMRTGLNYYDPAKGGYKDAFNDFLMAVLRSGIAARKDQKYGNMTADQWINSLDPEDTDMMEEASQALTAPYLGNRMDN
jgi:hypothetical protein